MPRIHNPHRRSHEDAKTGTSNQRTRPVVRERKTVSFLLPQEQRIESPVQFWTIPRDPHSEGHHRRRSSSESNSSAKRTSISSSTSTNSSTSTSRKFSLPSTTSPRVASPLLPAIDAQHVKWTPPSPNVNVPFPSTPESTSTFGTQTPPQSPRHESTATDYAEGLLPATVHRIVLDDTLTVPLNLRWDIRDHISRARDRHDQQVDLERPSGLPKRIKLATIEFESRDHVWLVKRWGPIIVNNQFTAITIGNILASISGYLREPIRDDEIRELILTNKDQQQLDDAWDARHENTFHRVHHDVPGVYRRLDVMKGEMHFQKISLRWVGEWACHISLSLMI